MTLVTRGRWRDEVRLRRKVWKRESVFFFSPITDLVWVRGRGRPGAHMFQEGCERKGVKERVRKRGYGREGVPWNRCGRR